MIRSNCCIGVRQLLGIADGELGIRDRPAPLLDGDGRDVDAVQLRRVLGRRAQQYAGTARDVEQPMLGSRAEQLEKDEVGSDGPQVTSSLAAIRRVEPIDDGFLGLHHGR